jgi:Spy/CpxP family protein refolding chaperone
MPNRRFFTSTRNIVLGSLLGLASGGALLSQVHSAEARPPRPEKMMKELGLSDEQREKIKSIREKSKDERKKSRQELQAAHEAFREKIESNASQAELRKLFNVVQDKRKAVAERGFSTALEVREVLNEEQRKKAGFLLGRYFDEGRPGKPPFKKGKFKHRGKPSLDKDEKPEHDEE